MNLFWPVYKNLEEEILELANVIHFSDDQSNVYSLHIADLIVRCAVEIEAISKELYYKVGGSRLIDENGKQRDLYFDTDCIELLDKRWKLSKKKVKVSAANFYFESETNNIFEPLHKSNKRGISGSKWKRAYQAVKHDRRNALKKANIINLLHAMGALYILNLYYKNQTINVGRVYLRDHDFDDRVGSEVFSVFIYKATGLSMSQNMDDSNICDQPDNDLEKSIYITKYDDKSFTEMHRNFCLDSKQTMINFGNSQVIKRFLQENPDYNSKSVNEVCMAAGGMSLLTQIVSLQKTGKEKDTRVEAVLNKHSNIYPALTEV